MKNSPFEDLDLPPEFISLVGATILSHAIQKNYETSELAHCTNKHQKMMLVILQHPRRMGELAKLLNMLPSSVTAIADVLEDLRFVSRERDPNDRRAWIVTLTDEGADMRQKLIAEASMRFRELTNLNADEIQELARLLTKTTDNISVAGFPNEALE